MVAKRLNVKEFNPNSFALSSAMNLKIVGSLEVFSLDEGYLTQSPDCALVELVVSVGVGVSSVVIQPSFHHADSAYLTVQLR